MMRWLLSVLLGILGQTAFAQTLSDSILVTDVQKHLHFLASDSLKGRGNYTPELQQAADYIAAAFKYSGIQFLPGLTSYFQPFTTKKLSKHNLQPNAWGRYSTETVLLNVIGVLPGSEKPAEAIIFSAHYDGVGIQKSGKDSVLNGANDNASGTAAVLTLMQYYAQQGNNRRTLIFCLFAGEEIGLKGSEVFVPLINAKAVKAVLNIEMIGRHDAVGKTSFFITGEAKSNLGMHFRKALKGSAISLKREPDADKELFMRSDNYPFALKGIPAHTIMSSDDDDACYHKTCDELERMDVANMTEIIKAIIVGSRNLIDGSVTPSRIRL